MCGISEQLEVFGRKGIQAERIAYTTPLRQEGLLKKWKEGQCDSGGGGSGKMKLGVI